jgi:hypothetical protein
MKGVTPIPLGRLLMKPLIIASCMLALAATASAQATEECPPAFKGAKVTARLHPSGARLEFRSGNRATMALMRYQLREVATMLEEKGTKRQTVSDTEEVEFPPVDIEVKNITAGALVTVRVTRLQDLTPIRELAFGFAEYWNSSMCGTPPMVSARELR